MRFKFCTLGLVGSGEPTGQRTHRTRIHRVWFLSLSERFYVLECQQHLFFICQSSHTPNYWNYTLVLQSKTWREALEYCRDKFHSLAILDHQSKVDAAVVQQDFPVWIGLHREGEAPSNHQQAAGCRLPAAITPVTRSRK